MLVLIQVVGTRNLSTLRSSTKTSATFAFNLKLNNAQETFTAEDAEDFAKARRGRNFGVRRLDAALD